jgi:hypothetical protein
MAHGRNLSDTVQKAALEALTTFCRKHPAEIANSAAKLIPVPERHIAPGGERETILPARATLTIALILSPQFASQKPCTTPTNGWWEKAYSIDTKSTDTKLRKWSVQLKCWRKPEQWSLLSRRKDEGIRPKYKSSPGSYMSRISCCSITINICLN